MIPSALSLRGGFILVALILGPCTEHSRSQGPSHPQPREQHPLTYYGNPVPTFAFTCDTSALLIAPLAFTSFRKFVLSRT